MIQPMSLGPAPQLQQLQQIQQLQEKTVQQATPAELTKTFGQFLSDAIDGVAAQEKNVHKMNDQYLIGQVDVTQLLIAAEQAQLSLQLTSQVRNKVVEAYQEMMRMQI